VPCAASGRPFGRPSRPGRGDFKAGLAARRRPQKKQTKGDKKKTKFGTRQQMWKKQAGPKTQKKRNCREFGKANALKGHLWGKWLQYVKEHAAGGPRLFILLSLTAVLCIRITQAARLKADDVKVSTGRVYIAPFKGHDSTTKKLPPSALGHVRLWVAKGASAKPVTRRCGARGVVKIYRKYVWPTKGFLFPSKKGCSKGHVTKDTVARQIRTIAKGFLQVYGNDPDLGSKQIRSHSGRRHAITWAASNGVPDTAGMEWSQIKNAKVYKGYAELDAEAVSNIINAADKKCRLAPKLKVAAATRRKRRQ